MSLTNKNVSKVYGNPDNGEKSDEIVGFICMTCYNWIDFLDNYCSECGEKLNWDGIFE